MAKEILHPSIKDDDEEDDELVSLFCYRVRKRGYLGRDQVFEKPNHRFYSDREVDKMLLSDDLRDSKRSTTQKRNARKKGEVDKVVSLPKKVADVEVEDRKENTDDNIVIAIGNKCKKDSLYLFKTPMPTVYKAGVKDFFFTMQFAYDGLSLIGMVTGEGHDKYLIATAEQPLYAYHLKDNIHPPQLPLRYTGYSSCFSKEAGSDGRDTL
ncbi:hypothetical protein FXO37_24760 [Capsicum annuum]|nr:hypothetical protein FXO37_24760 [Capsicum annuum]